MPVTNVDKDLDARTMTITAEFDAPVERVWRLWEDPRQLERWWGPPTYPATFVDHDFAPGGSVKYFMTSPEGDKYHGWWRVLALDPPRRLEFEDGFGDDTGEPNPDMPVTNNVVTLHDRPGGTRVLIETTFPSVAAMEQVIAMGVEEGLTSAMNQIDDILAAEAATGS
jgi:uncharacterized protein YndB with AHSA1/START domain